MKFNDNKGNIFTIVFLCIIIFSCIGALVGKTVYDTEKKSCQNLNPPTLGVSKDEFVDKIQVLTINSGDELLYQFCGEMDINISDDGTEIIFNTPCIKDCCFENGGENE